MEPVRDAKQRLRHADASRARLHAQTLDLRVRQDTPELWNNHVVVVVVVVVVVRVSNDTSFTKSPAALVRGDRDEPQADRGRAENLDTVRVHADGFVAHAVRLGVGLDVVLVRVPAQSPAARRDAAQQEAGDVFFKTPRQQTRRRREREIRTRNTFTAVRRRGRFRRFLGRRRRRADVPVRLAQAPRDRGVELRHLFDHRPRDGPKGVPRVVFAGTRTRRIIFDRFLNVLANVHSIGVSPRERESGLARTKTAPDAFVHERAGGRS